MYLHVVGAGVGDGVGLETGNITITVVQTHV